MSKHGSIWWSELMAEDAPAVAKFYAKVIGWQPFHASMGDMKKPAKAGEPSYTLFMQDGQPMCGAMTMSQAGMPAVPPRWFTYIAVDDVDKACKVATVAGGKVVKPAFDVPGVGRMAFIQDPEGAVVGLGTPAAAAKPAAAKKPKVAAKVGAKKK